MWDIPTRAFHWLLVVAFAAVWLTHDDDRYLDIHVFAGYTFLGLLGFRLLWGTVGSHYARFQSFAYGWPSVRAYVGRLTRGRPARHIGHNPAGSWAIFLMLGLGFAVSLTGLIVFGGEEGHGPLARVVPFPIGTAFRSVHAVIAWWLLIVTVVHVGGVLIESLLHRENLVRAMLNGYKQRDRAGIGIGVSRHRIVGLVLLAAGLVAAFAYFKGYLTDASRRPYRPFTGPSLPDNGVWREACGECHLAYHPTLLPARSWKELMTRQSDHFGEDLALEPGTVTAIARFLAHNAAENHLSEPAWKIDRSTPRAGTFLRVTETPYWITKHRDVPASDWRSKQVGGKGNCTACHVDAKEGTFEDAAMRLPKLPAGLR